MVNLILILLLLHYVGLYIFKPKINSFYCGIGGYIGNNFNKYKFNILGLYNDSRGGDSCGVFVGNGEDKDVQYGHDKTKLYKNFVELGGLKDVKLDSPNFALLHCRKASVGGISLATAQPVVIRDDNDKVVFAMIHNGTLVNYKELADKYGVEYTHAETDSQIFCRTIYKSGYRLLDEYDGAGAFVFWDSRDGHDTIKLFKGASLYYEDDNTIYIERPLFCISNENSFWFSSIKESLDFINDNNDDIIDIKTNVLFTIKNGKIIGEDKVDRSQRKQTEKLQTNWEKQRKLNEQNKKYYGYGNRGYAGYGEYDDWPDAEDVYDNYVNRYDKQTKSVKGILSPSYKTKNKICFCEDGLYYINDRLCDGAIESTPAGYTDISTVQTETYYFLFGVLMSSYFDYLCAKQFILQSMQGEDDCLEMYLAPYSPHPVPWVYTDIHKKTFVEFYSYDESAKQVELFNGSFEPFFSFKRDRYTLKDGVVMFHCEPANVTSKYIPSLEKTALDEQILNGLISKNQVKKMIRKNLREVYVKC